jgi:hypothetical protein
MYWTARFIAMRVIFGKKMWQRNIRGVCKKFGEWYQKTNKTEDTNKLTLLAFKIIAILHPQISPDLAPVGARSGEICGWTYFCFPA